MVSGLITQPVSTAHQILWIFTAPLVTDTSATWPTMVPKHSIRAMPRNRPGRQRLAPARFLGDQLEHRLVARMLAEPLAAELERILAGGRRQSRR